MSLAFKTKKGNKSDNNYYTPKSAWQDIELFLPKDKLIYEAFKGDGKSAEYLRELGCSVVSEDVDFFDNKIEFDVIVTNPPYSFKPKIFSRLRELDKPFILIVPVSTITKKNLSRLFRSALRRDNTKKAYSFYQAWHSDESQLV